MRRSRTCHRSLVAAALLLAVLSCGRPAVQTEAPKLDASVAARLRKILNENIVPCWMSRSLDHEHGGYVINFNPAGEPNGKSEKGLVTQARMLWFWSRLARSGAAQSSYSREQLLAAADLGYRFLREKMWDPENGGFYWEVDRSGDQKAETRKHVYGQTFALYALSEYYLASRKPEVLDFAADLFQLLEAKAHDETYGGYVEFFNADWTTPPADARLLLEGEAGWKLMNTHLHLMEALTTFYEASRLPLARERLLELITIESSTVVRKEWPACTNMYERDWTPRIEGEFGRVSYGHDVENIGLLLEANEAAGLSNYPLLDLYKALMRYSLQHGYDSSHGGFYDSGALGQPADRRTKIWWVQAEALVTSLRMYEITGDEQYLAVFLRTLDFVEKRQVDWQHGEWHREVGPDGTPRGDKADFWKAAYHNGRAMIECLEALERLQIQESPLAAR
jgi:mannobiose 2-epimerase